VIDVLVEARFDERRRLDFKLEIFRRIMMTNGIGTFFEPKGVVVVGARSSQGFGYGVPLILMNRGWGDRLHLVNPKGGELHGKPLHKSVSEVPDPVDLAIVLVPAPHVPGVLREIGKRGIGNVIIETAGFAEAGDEGKALQVEIKKAQEEAKLRVIGPNCIGLVNNSNGFCSAEILPEAFGLGNIGIIAQSGVFGNILLDKLCLMGLNVSKAITLGNRLDVNECEILEYLHQDPATEVIVLYLEGAADGRRLREVMAKVTADKPVIVLKSGRTEQGKAATASHTGSLSGEDDLYAGMFSQTGAIRAEGLIELIALARMFSTQPLPSGNRLGIITGSGSMGALATDQAVDNGLQILPPSEETVKKVKEVAPNWMNVKNPLDVGPSGLFQQGITAMAQDPTIDMFLGIVTIPHAPYSMMAQGGNPALSIYGDLKAIRALVPEKPFVFSVVAHDDIRDDVLEVAGTETPIFDNPEIAVITLAKMWQYRQWKNRK